MTPPPTTLPPNQGRILGDADVPSLLARTKRIAVLGIKTEAQHGQPAFDVPRYLDAAGFEIVPVPVYYPDVSTVLGPIDLVDIFRKPVDLDGHFDDIVAKRPVAIWLQLGIRNDAFAARIAAAGSAVVPDRRPLVAH